VQYADYLMAGDIGAAGGKYLCVVFNPFLRTSAEGDDQRIGPAERPGWAYRVRLETYADENRNLSETS